MPAGGWITYNEAKLTLGKKTIDLVNDTFKMILVANTSNAIDATLLNAWYATVTGELSTANGYTAGGITVAPTWTGDHTAPTKIFNVANAVWNATGSGLTARAAIIYDNTTSNKDLIAYCILGFDSLGNPADVTAPSGNPLSVLPQSAAGVLLLT